jgi:hypothetical protein
MMDGDSANSHAKRDEQEPAEMTITANKKIRELLKGPELDSERGGQGTSAADSSASGGGDAGSGEISGKNEVASRDPGGGASRVGNPGANSDVRRGAAGSEMNGADGRVAGGNVDDMGSGIVTIGDISSSESGSTDNGGTGDSSRSTLGGSNGRGGGADRSGNGDGDGCCHQTDAEAVGDKRPTPQVLDPWSKLQTKEALGEEADAGIGTGTDEDSGTTKSQKVDKGRGAGSGMSGGTVK